MCPQTLEQVLAGIATSFRLCTLEYLYILWASEIFYKQCSQLKRCGRGVDVWLLHYSNFQTNSILYLDELIKKKKDLAFTKLFESLFET